jgi:hypothetical protein
MQNRPACSVRTTGLNLVSFVIDHGHVFTFCSSAYELQLPRAGDILDLLSRYVFRSFQLSNWTANRRPVPYFILFQVLLFSCVYPFSAYFAPQCLSFRLAFYLHVHRVEHCLRVFRVDNMSMRSHVAV